MAFDESHFDAEAYLRQINSNDSLRIVISGHLYIEQMLSALIRTRLPHADVMDLADLRFPQLLDLASALDIVHSTEREAYFRLSRLRNKLAHELGAVVTNGDVDDLISAMNPLQRQLAEKSIGRRLLPGRDLQTVLINLFTNLQVRLPRFKEIQARPLGWLANYDRDLKAVAPQKQLAEPLRGAPPETR